MHLFRGLTALIALFCVGAAPGPQLLKILTCTHPDSDFTQLDERRFRPQFAIRNRQPSGMNWLFDAYPRKAVTVFGAAVRYIEVKEGEHYQDKSAVHLKGTMSGVVAASSTFYGKQPQAGGSRSARVFRVRTGDDPLNVFV
jgi:hypothetical protein